MSFQLSIDPRSEKSINDVLRGRARMVALRRLKQTMGTMALEKQSPEAEKFRALLEKQTDELLADKRARLWAGDDD